MRPPLLVAVALGAAAVLPVVHLSTVRAVPAPGPQPLAYGAHGPAAFVPNLGQWSHGAAFVAQMAGGTVFIESTGMVVSVERHDAAAQPAGLRGSAGSDATVHGAAVRLRLAGGRATGVLPEQRLAGVHHYFLGSDPARWRTDVPRFARVRWPEAWPGIDVVAYGRSGCLEYDVELAPGAALARVEIAVEGAREMRIDAGGALVIATAAGELRQDAPRTWAVDRAGRRRAMPARFELRGRDRFGFVAPERRDDETLVVDPGLTWSTYVGSGAGDHAGAVAVEANGVVTIAGGTASPGFPTTVGAWSRTLRGGTDAIVTRLDPARPAAQQLVWSTFIGGQLSTSFGTDSAAAVVVDAAGVVTIAGTTDTPDFPVTAGAWDTSFNGGMDAFIARIDPSRTGAQQLVWSTFVGGERNDWASSLAVDGVGIVTIAGATNSVAYPTTANAWDTSFNGGRDDAFVTRIDPTRPAAQQLVWSTFVGGADDDASYALSVDAGLVTITGLTSSPTWPTTAGAWSRVNRGNYDGFVTRLDPAQSAAQQLTWSTFIGGTGVDAPWALAVDPRGVVTIAGMTASLDHPVTANAWSTIHAGYRDAFVSQLDPTLPGARQLLWSTYLGTGAEDRACGLAVDRAGVVTVAGWTGSSPLFPTTPGAWNRVPRGGVEGFVTRFDPSRPPLRQMLYSTLIGGTQNDYINALAVDAAGVATIAGLTVSLDYPTAAAWQTFNGGSYDAFVTRLDLLPAGVVRFGGSSPGCTGPLAVSVTSQPYRGNATFALTCSNAPPATIGLGLLSGAGLATPLLVAGIEVWIAPALLWATVPTASSNLGSADLLLPVPSDPALVGGRVFGQFIWVGPNAPAPCPPLGLSASAALDITVQP